MGRRDITLVITGRRKMTRCSERRGHQTPPVDVYYPGRQLQPAAAAGPARADRRDGSVLWQYP